MVDDSCDDWMMDCDRNEEKEKLTHHCPRHGVDQTLVGEHRGAHFVFSAYYRD